MIAEAAQKKREERRRQDGDRMAEVFEYSMQVRYMEVDAQGVVFNGWYLTYFDEAFTAYLAHRGVSYPQLLDGGFDVQLVRSEIDWRSGLRWQDDARIAVSTGHLGTTSFALNFEVRRADEVTCTAQTVYVVVATDGSGKRPIPADLRRSLTGASGR